MRKIFSREIFSLFIAVLSLGIISCNKEVSSPNNSTGNSTATTSTSATIAALGDSSGSDSVYIIQQCGPGFFRNSVDSTALPANLHNYLDSAYTGFHYLKSFEITDSAGANGGYVVIISFNGKPVGLQFDASGNFKTVLEQREGEDIHGRGWHHGGRYGNRDGQHHDTVALANLPSSISGYLQSNYPGDTLVRAYINRDSTYLVITSNNGLFANLFASNGNFVKRITIEPHENHGGFTEWNGVSADSLNATITGYLMTTYPGWVFESAFSVTDHNSLQGYIVVIDANNTKYAVEFDGNGNFIFALVVW
jgi:hypothetical protein